MAELRKQEKALRLLLLGGIFFIPISIWCAEAFLYIYAPAVWAYALLRYRDSRALRNPYFWPVVLFAALAVAASAWGVNPSGSFRKCHRLLLLATVFMIGDAFRADRPAYWANLELAVMAFVAGATVQGIYNLVLIPLQVSKGTPWLVLGNMMDPQMCLVSYCFLLAMIGRPPPKYPRALLMVLLLVSVAGIIIHLKRGVWLAAGLSTILIALLGRRQRVGLWVFVLLLVGLPLALTRKPITAKFEQTRLVLWTEAAPELLREHPWGVGYTGTYGLLEKYTPRMREPQQHLHNNALQIAVEMGWLGLALWLAWMATTFWVLLASYRALRAHEPEMAGIALGAFAAFCGLMTHGMVEYNFGDSEILMVFTFLMGLSAVLWQKYGQLRA